MAIHSVVPSFCISIQKWRDQLTEGRSALKGGVETKWQELEQFFASLDEKKTQDLSKRVKKNLKTGAKICSIAATAAKVAKGFFSSPIQLHIDRFASTLGISKFVALFSISDSFEGLLKVIYSFSPKEVEDLRTFVLVLSENLLKFLADFTEIVDQSNKLLINSIALKEVCAYLWQCVLILSAISWVSEWRKWGETHRDLECINTIIKNLSEIEPKKEVERRKELATYFNFHKEKFEKYLSDREKIEEICTKHQITLLDREEHQEEINRIHNLFMKAINSQWDEAEKEEVDGSLNVLRLSIEETIKEKSFQLFFSTVSLATNTVISCSHYFPPLLTAVPAAMVVKVITGIYLLCVPKKK